VILHDLRARGSAARRRVCGLDDIHQAILQIQHRNRAGQGGPDQPYHHRHGGQRDEWVDRHLPAACRLTAGGAGRRVTWHLLVSVSGWLLKTGQTHRSCTTRRQGGSGAQPPQDLQLSSVAQLGARRSRCGVLLAQASEAGAALAASQAARSVGPWRVSGQGPQGAAA